MIVVAHKMGRLGNRLFLFGHLIASAIEARTTAIYPGFGEYADLFEGPSRGRFPSFPANGRSWPRLVTSASYWSALMALRMAKRGLLPGVPWFDMSWNVNRAVDVSSTAFLELAAGRVVLCGGFFYGSPLLQKHADAVRSYFRPARRWSSSLSALCQKMRDGADHLVGVHIRRTDFKTFRGGIFHYERDVYLAYMRRLRDLLPGRCRFLISSDEPIDMGVYQGFDVVSAPGDILFDLQALSACDCIVAPPGTYSGWASFSGSTPIHFIGDGRTELADGLQLEDFAIDYSGWTSAMPHPSGN